MGKTDELRKQLAERAQASYRDAHLFEDALTRIKALERRLEYYEAEDAAHEDQLRGMTSLRELEQADKPN